MISADSRIDEAAVPTLSVRQTFGIAVGFLWREATKIAPRLLLPLVIGGVAFYFSLDLYLTLLERYLLNPNDRVASVLLGVATAGLLVTLFMHSVTVASLASLGVGREDHGWKFFCVSRRSWRLYAAYLRFLLVCAACLSVVVILQSVLLRAGAGAWVSPAGELLLVLVFAVLAADIGFLLPAVASANDGGQVVRQSLRLSWSNTAKLLFIVVVITLLGGGLETAGEIAVWNAGLVPVMNGSTPPLALVTAYRVGLPVMLIVIGVAYVVVTLLATAAAVAAYRQIAPERASP